MNTNRRIKDSFESDGLRASLDGFDPTEDVVVDETEFLNHLEMYKYDADGTDDWRNDSSKGNGRHGRDQSSFAAKGSASAAFSGSGPVALKNAAAALAGALAASARAAPSS